MVRLSAAAVAAAAAVVGVISRRRCCCRSVVITVVDLLPVPLVIQPLFGLLPLGNFAHAVVIILFAGGTQVLRPIAHRLDLGAARRLSGRVLSGTGHPASGSSSGQYSVGRRRFRVVRRRGRR